MHSRQDKMKKRSRENNKSYSAERIGGEKMKKLIALLLVLALMLGVKARWGR